MAAEFQNPERTERISVFVKDLPREELIQTTLRAIDHAYAASAEVEAQRVPVADLEHRYHLIKVDNDELLERIESIEASFSYRLGRLLTLPFRLLRRLASQ